jgi:putative salt-induced outer membrane protein
MTKTRQAIFRVFVLATLCFFASLAAAQDPSPWSGIVALGYLASSGNTDTTAFNFNGEVNYDVNKWHNNLLGRAILKTDNNRSTAEAYKAAYKLKYDLSDRNYLFGLLDYNNDRFSSYDQQVFEIVGAGRRFIVTEKHQLNGELGIGASQSDFRDCEAEDVLAGACIIGPPQTPPYGTSENEVTYRVSGDYTWQISENASFVQKLSVNIGSNNTYTESLTELRAGIVGDIGLVLSYTIKNNSDVAPGTDKTDTYTAISLEYAFGQN